MRSWQLTVNSTDGWGAEVTLCDLGDEDDAIRDIRQLSPEARGYIELRVRTGPGSFHVQTVEMMDRPFELFVREIAARYQSGGPK